MGKQSTEYKYVCLLHIYNIQAYYHMIESDSYAPF